MEIASNTYRSWRWISSEYIGCRRGSQGSNLRMSAASVQRGSSQEGSEKLAGHLRRHDVGRCKLLVGVALRVIVDALRNELWLWLVCVREYLEEVVCHQVVRCGVRVDVVVPQTHPGDD